MLRTTGLRPVWPSSSFLRAESCCGGSIGKTKSPSYAAVKFQSVEEEEYVAYLAQHLDVIQGSMTFFRQSLILSREGLAQIVGTIQHGGYGLVLISSWQACRQLGPNPFERWAAR